MFSRGWGKKSSSTSRSDSESSSDWAHEHAVRRSSSDRVKKKTGRCDSECSYDLLSETERQVEVVRAQVRRFRKILQGK